MRRRRRLRRAITAAGSYASFFFFQAEDGIRDLRRMIIHGARSCVTHLDRSRYRLGAWLDGLQARMHTNKVTVALAAKIARIAWVVMTKPGASYERRVPAFS